MRPPAKSFVRYPLDAILGAPSHVAILRALQDRPTGTTGRQIAEIAGITPKAAHDSLARLETTGLVTRLPAGKAYVFRLNPRHRLLQKGIAPLFEAEKDFREEIRTVLRKDLSKEVVTGAIFGSASRGEDVPRSDLDVCLIVENDGAKERANTIVNRLTERAREEFGLRLAPVVFTRVEFLKGYRGKNPFFQNVVKEGEHFAGLGLREVVGGKANAADQGVARSGRELRRGRPRVQ